MGAEAMVDQRRASGDHDVSEGTDRAGLLGAERGQGAAMAFRASAPEAGDTGNLAFLHARRKAEGLERLTWH
jgi:hypothetical protein